MAGSFVLILHTHLPYVLNHEKWPHGSDWLTEAAAECYIPLLNVCHELLLEGITPNITLSLSPVLVEQLADPAFATLFTTYLDERAEAAERDCRHFDAQPEERFLKPLAEYWVRWYKARKKDFVETYESNLVAAIRKLAERGAIAIQTCGATHGYFPLLGRDESISAQLNAAVASHTKHFGEAPRGVWMPECAYRPAYEWVSPIPNAISPRGIRKGVEQHLMEHGLEYTVIDSAMLRGGKPYGIFGPRYEAVRNMAQSGLRFLPLDDTRSVHDLYRACSTGHPEAGNAVVFARDTETTMRVWSGTSGYPGEGNYLEFHKKYHRSGHRYWAVTDSKADLGHKRLYNPGWVEEKIKSHARHFVTIIEQEMWKFQASTGREGTLAAPFDTELFGHWWFEGPRFLKEVLRLISRSPVARARTAPDELTIKNPGVMVQIPEGSWGDGGDHRVWHNEKVDWTWPMIYEIEELFLDLLKSHDHSDDHEGRILRQMAREQMLLQASDWQFLITTGGATDYATKRFLDHYANAKFLAGLVTANRTGALSSLADHEQLCTLESKNRIFPDLELTWWKDRKDVLCAQG